MGGELEVLQAVNLLLGKCLSMRVQKAMVRYEQLPEWQKKSSLRLPGHIQLISCQTFEKLKKRWLKVLHERNLSKKPWCRSKSNCGSLALS
jgi:hypothetical protein